MQYVFHGVWLTGNKNKIPENLRDNKNKRWEKTTKVSMRW